MFLNTVIVEAHLARGMSIDDFAPNPSSSNGPDAEYSAIGRLAAIAWPSRASSPWILLCPRPGSPAPSG